MGRHLLDLHDRTPPRACLVLVIHRVELGVEARDVILLVVLREGEVRRDEVR